MTSAPADELAYPRARRTNTIVDLDADLQRTVRHTAYMRQLFYIVVLLVALAGQVSGAVEALGIPLIWAIPAVGALELGGIVVLANADVRRRLGERATASRVLSAVIAASAVAFNWTAHTNTLLAGFFAGMSALGYLVWLMHTENQRRDRLRATGNLPPTTPAYEVVGHWMRHPWLTVRAKNLAKADPRLGLYTSLAAARAEQRRELRTSAIAKVLRRKIRAAVDPTAAEIAINVYDLDEIALRLADSADYDGLTALIAADLAPVRLTNDMSTQVDHPAIAAASTASGGLPDPDGSLTDDAPSVAAAAAPGLSATTLPATPVPALEPPSPASVPPPADPRPYEPIGHEDAAMYQAWRRGVATGQEPTGADLARAAGRVNDTTGFGRRAARRYRNAHTNHRHTGSSHP
ncbi:hypothetical protein [Dactylosporangium darangshiense]|uniref:Uncharacterized protein n=1 Tax=Dactylosporangium darangshiense TaxID=579108 RepID=A0ABP8DS30_9ACTN